MVVVLTVFDALWSALFLQLLSYWNATADTIILSLIEWTTDL